MMRDGRRTDSLNRSLHGRAGRQAVVDQQHDAVAELDRRAAGPIHAFSRGELGLLATRDVINEVAGTPSG